MCPLTTETAALGNGKQGTIISNDQRTIQSIAIKDIDSKVQASEELIKIDHENLDFDFTKEHVTSQTTNSKETVNKQSDIMCIYIYIYSWLRRWYGSNMQTLQDLSWDLTFKYWHKYQQWHKF